MKLQRIQGAKIVNFDKDEYIDVQNKDYEILDKFRIARTLRTGGFCGFRTETENSRLDTIHRAIKNMLGSIPGNGKKNVHLIAPKPTIFAKALVDIYQMGTSPPHYYGRHCRYGGKRTQRRPT